MLRSAMRGKCQGPAMGGFETEHSFWKLFKAAHNIKSNMRIRLALLDDCPLINLNYEMNSHMGQNVENHVTNPISPWRQTYMRTQLSLGFLVSLEQREPRDSKMGLRLGWCLSFLPHSTHGSPLDHPRLEGRLAHGGCPINVFVINEWWHLEIEIIFINGQCLLVFLPSRTSEEPLPCLARCLEDQFSVSRIELKSCTNNQSDNQSCHVKSTM